MSFDGPQEAFYRRVEPRVPSAPLPSMSPALNPGWRMSPPLDSDIVQTPYGGMRRMVARYDQNEAGPFQRFNYPDPFGLPRVQSPLEGPVFPRVRTPYARENTFGPFGLPSGFVPRIGKFRAGMPLPPIGRLGPSGSVGRRG
jgi:hypothetical protein